MGKTDPAHEVADDGGFLKLAAREIAGRLRDIIKVRLIAGVNC